MRVVVILARILVLLVALGGAGWTASLGALLYYGLYKSEQPNSTLEPATGDMRQEMLKSIPFLLAGGFLGLVGGLLAVFGRPGNATVWLLVAGVGPVFLSPGTLCATFGLFGAAFLSLLTFILDVTTQPRSEPAA